MRWIRPTRLPILIAWMTILGALAWFGAHPRLVAPFASRLISRELIHRTGGSIRVQDFRVRAFEGIDLYGVSLSLPGGKHGMTLVSADTVVVDFNLGEILGGTPRLRRLSINRPEVYSRAGKGNGQQGEPGNGSAEERVFTPLIIDKLEISQAFLEFSGSDGRLIERLSHVDWTGTFSSGRQIHLQLHGCDVAWDTHQSLLTELRGDVVIDYRELSVPRAFGFLNGHPVEASGFRRWDGLLDIAVDCHDVSIAETENLIDMNIGFSARGDLQGTFFASGDTVVYSGLFNGELEGYDLRELVGKAVIADDKVVVSGLSGRINEASFAGGGVFHVLDPKAVSFVLEGDVRDADLAKGLVPEAEDLPRTDGHGRLKIEHTMQPTWTRVSGFLRDGFIDIVPFDSCAVDVEALVDSVTFNRIDLRYGDLNLVLTGDTDRDLVFRGRLQGRSGDLGTLPTAWGLPPLSGRATFRGDLYGPLEDLAFSGSAGANDFTLATGGFGTAEAVVVVEDILGDPLVAAEIEGRGLALGGVDLGDFRAAGSAGARSAQVDSFRSVLGDTIVALAFRAGYGDSVQQFAIDRFVVSLEGTRWAMTEPAGFTIGPGRFSLPDLRIVSDQGAVTASGHYERDLMVGGSLQMRGFDLGLLEPFMDNSEPLRGRLTADVVVGGEPAAPVVILTGDLVEAPFSLANIDSLHLAVSFSQGVLEFEDLDLLTNFGQVRGRGSVSHPGAGVKDFWPGAELDADLQVLAGDWKFMEQFALPALDRLAGSFSGNLTVAGTTDDPLIKGDLSSAPFDIHWLHLDELKGNIWADRSSLILGDLSGRKDNLNLTGRLELPLELDFLHEPVPSLQGPFYMQLAVPPGTDLESLAQATNAFVQFSGTGSGSVVVSGPLDHPLYQGQLTVQEAGFVLRDMEEVYHGISATGVFEGDKLRINDIRGGEGLKGTLQGQGTLTFHGLLLKAFDVRLDLDRFLVASVPDLRALVKASGARISSVYVGPDSILVPKFSGELEVIRGRYTGDFTEKPGAADPLQATVAPDWLADLKLHGDPRTVRILNRELELYLGGDLDLIRDLEGLYLRGTLDVNAGRLIVFNNTFNVERGRLDFSREVGFDPRIDLDAVTKHRLRSRFSNNSVIENISVHVGATLAKPEISFSSDQGYSREAIQRMLLGLDPYPDVTGGEVAQLRASSITAGFNVLEREIAQELNLVDTFEIEQIRRERETGETGLDPLIGVGKYIGSDLYLKVAQGVKQEDRDILVEYQINRYLLLQSEIRRRIDENQGQETYNLDLNTDPPRLWPRSLRLDTQDGATVDHTLDKLNDAQRQAVTCPDGPVLVVAGAGSGKTRVLTTRIAWLMEEKAVPAGEILAFTFTNRAASQMRERVAVAVGPGRAPFWIGTFHATGLKILRNDGAAIGVPPGFSIYDTDDSKRLLKQVMADLNIDSKQFTPAGTLAAISRWKNEDLSCEAAKQQANTFIEKKYAELYEGYVAALGRSNALDFDDLILRTVHLLEQDEEVRAKYSRRFRHVLVDEFQDTNPLQLLMVKLLSNWHGNLFVVGDDDQSIYSWRGARIENMLKFDEYFPGAQTYRLEQNYRSTGNILQAANEVIAHNKRRKGKNLWTEDPAGDRLTEEEFYDDEDEAARLVDIVRAEQGAGLSRSDLTVLYRTNAQSRSLEDALRRAHLPYQIVGSTHFYDRREVRDVLAYLKLIVNPADVVAVQRVINVPKRKIGQATVERLVRLARSRELTLGEAAAEDGLLEQEIAPAGCRRVREFFDQAVRWRMRAAEGLPAHELVGMVVRDIGYEKYLEADDPAVAGGRSENVAELVNAAGSFHESSGGGTLAQFLEQVALVSDPDTIRDDEGTIRLMTIHTAKGLEFPVVVVAGCEDEILPHINSHDEAATLEEERRLFYVALTRAQKRVYLLHAARRRRFGSWQDSLPSRFLREVPDALIERRHLDRPETTSVARSLFGDQYAGGSLAASRRRLAAGAAGSRSTAPLGGQPAGGKPYGGKPSRGVRPEEWGASSRKTSPPVRPAAGHGAPAQGWESEISQETPYFEGQTVSHGIFGSGVVVRVEGAGGDMMVTVDFQDVGRKHLNPRFAPLVGVD